MKVMFLKGQQEGESLNLKRKDEYLIGRDFDCDIRVLDLKSSRHHARIFLEEGTYFIEDLESTNGTVLNTELIIKTELSEFDEIIIGDAVIQVSDFFHHDFGSSTSLHINEQGSSTVIVSSINHREADLLSGGKKDSAADLAEENRILRKISEISQISVQHRDTQKLLDTILSSVQEVIEADTACILFWSDKDNDWVIRSQSVLNGDEDQEVNVSRTIIDQALSDDMAILSSDTMSDGRFDPSMSIISEGISSAICSPIKIGSGSKCVIFVDRRKNNKLFNDMELRFTATVANMLGLIFEKEELEEAGRKKERLAVIGEVIAGLAHYTKNIITGLRFSINALEIVSRRKQYDSIERCLHSITVQERRISELVLNMLSYSKDRKPFYSKINLNDLLNDLIEPYYNFLRDEKIQAELTIPENLPEIYVDETSIHRLLLNLFLNAIDAFKADSAKENKKIIITVSQDDDKVKISVRDTGCGIPENKKNNIFKVFFSTKGSEGTGLGLAVVKKIVDEHAGSISVVSESGQGTEFIVTLPIGAEQNF